MKTVIEMAREADRLTDERLQCPGEFHPDYGTVWNETFAALVREDEREKQQEPVAVGAYEVVNEDGNEWELVYPEAIHKYKMIPEHRITQTFYTTPPTAALAARQMRDAAVKVCLEEIEDPAPSSDYVMGYQDAAAKLSEEIAALPIPGEEK